jgi:hypothetical protein
VTDTRAALAAGVLAGVAGLLTFLAVHHLWIAPIWFIVGPGLVVAALGGSLIGWGYAEIRAGLPRRPWTHLGLFCVVGVILAPAIVLSALRPALFDVNTGGLAPGSTLSDVAARFVAELLIPATVVGSLVGRRLGSTSRAVLAMGLAGFVFALGPGHNIPLLAGTSGVGKGTLLLVAITAVSTLVLVESHAWLSRRAAARPADGSTLAA